MKILYHTIESFSAITEPKSYESYNCTLRSQMLWKTMEQVNLTLLLLAWRHNPNISIIMISSGVRSDSEKRCAIMMHDWTGLILGEPSRLTVNIHFQLMFSSVGQTYPHKKKICEGVRAADSTSPELRICTIWAHCHKCINEHYTLDCWGV